MTISLAGAKPIIALDADGVLLDYHAAYRQAWAQAFGALPELRDPMAYWPIDRWHVRHLEGNELVKFRACFNHDYWSSIPAIPGAVRACEDLRDAGYELVCVSAIESHFQAARLQNIRDCGFPIEHVIATANTGDGSSPKAEALRELRPVAFVDDFLPYLRGIPADIHAALVLREPNGSPNIGDDLALAHSQHSDLAAFASWWINRHLSNQP
jgi:phosphoglycolate phosphatase-like HAD superfamily hydrolase